MRISPHWNAMQAAQVRPLLSHEKAKSSSECVEVPSTTVVQLPPRRGTSSDPFRFDFDRVYKMSNPGMAGTSSIYSAEWHFIEDCAVTAWPLQSFRTGGPGGRVNR